MTRCEVLVESTVSPHVRRAQRRGAGQAGPGAGARAGEDGGQWPAADDAGAVDRADRRGGRCRRRDLPGRRHLRTGRPEPAAVARRRRQRRARSGEDVEEERPRGGGADRSAPHGGDPLAGAAEDRLASAFGDGEQQAQRAVAAYCYFPTGAGRQELAHERGTTARADATTERVDVEISHAELRSLFLQLNAIQAELDVPPAPSAA
ncbi:hypothetical protein ON010_g7817 [Phytophthora cinnamomi]|nr:hypothetical protein ON010_g7817 [Phytophthora cinnamomi]